MNWILMWASAEEECEALRSKLAEIAGTPIDWTKTDHHYYAGIAGRFQLIAAPTSPKSDTEECAAALGGQDKTVKGAIDAEVANVAATVETPSSQGPVASPARRPAPQEQKQEAGELVKDLEQIARHDYAMEDPTTGEAFYSEGRVIMEAAATLLSLAEKLAEAEQGWAREHEARNKAEREIERHERHEQTLRENGIGSHTEAIARIASLEQERDEARHLAKHGLWKYTPEHTWAEWLKEVEQERDALRVVLKKCQKRAERRVKELSDTLVTACVWNTGYRNRVAFLEQENAANIARLRARDKECTDLKKERDALRAEKASLLDTCKLAFDRLGVHNLDGAKAVLVNAEGDAQRRAALTAHGEGE